MDLILQDTKKVITVNPSVFGCAFNESLIHQIIVSYAANGRQGTSSQKTRSEVAGSNKKPWRQKGTGRARAGSMKSPIWRSGGVTFTSKSRNYHQKINRKMYRGAIKSIFSELIRNNRLLVFENFAIDQPKTKLLMEKLRVLNVKSSLIIINDLDERLFLAARNIHKIDVRSVQNINPIILINFDTTIITADAIQRVEKMLL